MISPGLLAIVEPLAATFRANGYQLYLVGGIVRDELIAHGSRDWSDIDLTTDARPDETKRLVAPLATALWAQGERFGTIGCRIGEHPFEITTFRGEAYDPDSRKPAVVFADALDSDLSRRDFTINAMAADASTGALHDPFDGRRDLAARVLRTPLGADTSFSDDPLRMLRAARFLARFALEAAPDIDDAIARQRARLGIVSAERVRDELHKLLAVADPTRGLAFLVGHRLLDRWLPDLGPLREVHDPSHGGVDSLDHTFAVVAACDDDVVVRLAALLHDIGKCSGLADHAARGAARATEQLLALRHSHEEIRRVRTLIALHHRVHDRHGTWDAPEVRLLLADAGDQIDALMALTVANAGARRGDLASVRRARVSAFERARVELGETAADLVPELDGDAIMALLGIGPGPEVGEARTFLRTLRIERGSVGAAQATRAVLDWWNARSATEG